MSTETSKIADALFRSGCMKFGSFKLKSEVVSPYYIDLSWLLSSARDLCSVVDVTAEEIRRLMLRDRIDRLASIELKGALLIPSIACKLNLPCLVVRKKKKTYGVTSRVAGGNVIEGERLLLFDDVITDGGSKLEGIRPLERLGACIEMVLVVVDREQGGRENLEKMGYRFRALTTISELVKALFQSSHISREQADTVLEFIKR